MREITLAQLLSLQGTYSVSNPTTWLVRILQNILFGFFPIIGEEAIFLDQYLAEVLSALIDNLGCGMSKHKLKISIESRHPL